MTRDLISPALILAALAGCQDLPSLEYHSEHLDVGLDGGGRFCEGDLQQFEAHLIRISEELDISIDEKIELYYYMNPLPPQCDGARGCFDERKNRIFTNFSSWDHELAHAVISQRTKMKDLASPFVSEGLAESYVQRALTFPSWATLPSENANLEEPKNVDYSTAGHFFRFVKATHGPEAIRRLSRGESFGAATDGVGLNEAEQEWLEDSAWAYPGTWCEQFSTQSALNGRWEMEVELTCDDPDVLARGSSELSTCRRVELPQAGLYLLEASGLTTLSRCALDEVWDAEPRYPPPDDTAEYHVPNQQVLQGGAEVELLLKSGPHVICVVGMGEGSLAAFDLLDLQAGAVPP